MVKRSRTVRACARARVCVCVCVALLAAVSHSDCASARLAESLPLLRLARTHGFAPFQCSTHAPHQRALPEAIPAPEPAAAASDAAAQPPARLPSGGPGCTPWAGLPGRVRERSRAGVLGGQGRCSPRVLRAGCTARSTSPPRSSCRRPRTRSRTRSRGAALAAATAPAPHPRGRPISQMSLSPLTAFCFIHPRASTPRSCPAGAC